MTKNTITPTVPTADLISVSLPKGFAVEALGYKIEITAETLSGTLTYLLQNGFSQAMRDSVAGKAEADKKEALDKKFKTITEATIGHLVGKPRGSKEETIRRAVMLEIFKKSAAANKVAMPKGEALAPLFTAYYAAAKAEIDAEVSRRMSVAGTVDLASLMAGLVTRPASAPANADSKRNTTESNH